MNPRYYSEEWLENYVRSVWHGLGSITSKKTVDDATTYIGYWCGYSNRHEEDMERRNENSIRNK